MLNIKINVLWVQKHGNLESEYEDAFAQYPAGSLVQAGSCRLAIADGASESSFANIWAKQVVRSYCLEPFRNLSHLKERINPLYERWQRIVFRKPLPWYAEQKALIGAFATFLGLEISSQHNQAPAGGAWQAIAIGDSCIFQIHTDELHISWPVVHSECFDNTPALLGSFPDCNEAVWEQVQFQHGSWQKGDLIILATDALSAWFLKEVENDRKPWSVLVEFTKKPDPAASFREWVAQKQTGKILRNDDVTCLIVELG